MSQSGFEMFSNVAGMVIVIADVIFFYALWNIFCKNKKEKRYIAEFEDKGIQYQLKGVMKKDEFEKILKNLFFV